MNDPDEFELTRLLYGEPGEDRDARERMRARLRATIDREKRLRRNRRWWGAGAFAAAAAIALTVALVLPSGISAGAVELRRLGRISASMVGPDIEPGQFVLTEVDELRPESKGFLTEDGEESEFTVLSRLRIWTWIAPDGSGFRRTRVLASAFASPADRQTWIDAGRPHVLAAPGDVRTDRFPAAQAPWFDTSALSDDPDQVLEAIRSGEVVERSPGDDQVFGVIGEVLAQGDAPAGVRAALFEAASELEGIQLVGSRADPLGGRGVALAVDGTRSRTQLVFDPGNARLLSIEFYALNEDGSPGRLESWLAPRSTTVVDEAPRI